MESRDLSRENVHTVPKRNIWTSVIVSELIFKHDPAPFSLTTSKPKFCEKATTAQYTAEKSAWNAAV